MQDYALSHKAIGRNLARWRHDHRLTQDHLAADLDLKRPAISQIEAGTRKLTVAELIVLAEHHGLTFDTITSGVPIAY